MYSVVLENTNGIQQGQQRKGCSYKFKVLLLGDAGVGKTCLAHRCSENRIPARYKKTVGVDFYLTQLSLPEDVHVGLQLWDIGGDSTGSMLTKYVYGCQGVLLVYDMSHLQSFLNLRKWIATVQEVCGPRTMPYLVLVGNKSDQSTNRAVREELHNAYASELRAYSCNISAMTGDGVMPALTRIAADLAGVPCPPPPSELPLPGMMADNMLLQRRESSGSRRLTLGGKPTPPSPSSSVHSWNRSESRIATKIAVQSRYTASPVPSTSSRTSPVPLITPRQSSPLPTACPAAADSPATGAGSHKARSSCWGACFSCCR